MNQVATIIPIPVKKQPHPCWTAAACAKREKTWARNRRKRERERREKLRAERATRRVRLDGKPKERRSEERRTEDPAYREKAPRGASVGPIRRNRKPPTGRDLRTLTEERSDAIAYLEAAVGDYGGIPDAILLPLLALRRLQGRIK